MLKKVPTVILTGPPPENIGGVATHMRSLLEGRLACEFNLVFLEAGSRNKEFLLERIFRVLRSAIRLRSLLCQQSRAILHLNPSMDTKALLRDMFLAIVGKLSNAKIFIQFHGGRLNRVKWFSWPPFKQLFYAILKQVDLITVLSQEQLESMRAVYGARCEQLKLECLPALFLDFQAYQRPQQGRSRSEQVRFLFLGRVIREKGIFEIIEAFAQVRQKLPQAVLTIAGTGPALEDAQRLCENMGLLPAVEFLGFVTGAWKIAALHQADVFLLPSYWEGLPYALLEAMAAGLPVIISPNGAIRDVFEDGVHGFLVPPKNPPALAEKMLLLAKEPALQEKMGQTNQLYIQKHFSLERQREIFGEIYRQLLSGTRGNTCKLSSSL